jgi:tryptophan synthase alpha subunit
MKTAAALQADKRALPAKDPKLKPACAALGVAEAATVAHAATVATAVVPNSSVVTAATGTPAARAAARSKAVKTCSRHVARSVAAAR